MQEHWVYTFEESLEGWETYGVYTTREDAQKTLDKLTKWGKRAKIQTTYDF
jgi:hypothetical protein